MLVLNTIFKIKLEFQEEFKTGRKFSIVRFFFIKFNSKEK